MSYLSDFFHKSMVHKLDYHHLMLDCVEGDPSKRLVSSWDYDGLDLTYLNGDPGGNLGASQMPYWRVASLRMKIPRGGLGKFVILEIQ